MEFVLVSQITHNQREDIQIFPECNVTDYGAARDQIYFLFLCTEEHYFYG